MRVAKVSLVADISGFKKNIESAKASLEGMSKVKLPPELARKYEQKLSGSLKKQAEELSTSVKSAERKLKNLLAKPTEVIDLKQVAAQTSAIDRLKKRLEEINVIQKRINKDGIKPSEEGAVGKPRTTEGAPGGVGKIFQTSMVGMSRLITGLVGGIGIITSVRKMFDITRERQEVSALTGGAQVREEGNRVAGRALGYTRAEKRQTAADIAREVGRDMGAEELGKMVDLSEVAQRGWGVEKGQTAEFMGTARRGGVQDQANLFSKSIGAAVASGLEGSQIGRYLSSMTGFMQEMSEGVNIDADSLNGFAASLSTLPFFKSDPTRAFSAMRGMNEAFKSGDRFQQGQAVRAILQSVPGASPEAVEMRRSVGLFGKSPNVESMKKLGFSQAGISAQTIRPEKIVDNILKEIEANTGGLTGEAKTYEMMQRLNLSRDEAVDIMAARKEGKGFTEKQIKKLESAQMDPTDRLNKTMSGTNDNMMNLQTAIESLKEELANNIGPPIGKIAEGLGKLMDFLGFGDRSSKMKEVGQVGTAGVVGMTAASVLGTGPGAAAGGAYYAGQKMPQIAGPGGLMDWAGEKATKGTWLGKLGNKVTNWEKDLLFPVKEAKDVGTQAIPPAGIPTPAGTAGAGGITPDKITDANTTATELNTRAIGDLITAMGSKGGANQTEIKDRTINFQSKDFKAGKR